MPSKLKTPKFYVTAQELESLRQQAAEAGKTISNLIREKCGLSELKRGAIGNTNNKYGHKGKPRST